eukprot:TRINITY_DN19080_c0_g1_i1.p1 TRINITY_DN19080_c0_g1~~TRINITY_DN19080_c0_g1_i1.p1  ORF type:complete len:262 (-),score=33.71 TRINITY_DN19080_c0_g1_i1:177-962(-)
MGRLRASSEDAFAKGKENTQGATTPRFKGDKPPTLLGLSHIRRAPKWSFNNGRDSLQTARSAHAPGPGTYALLPPDTASKFNRGSSFSFGTSGRDVVGKPKVPGPGAYSLRKDAGATCPAWTMSARRPIIESEADGPGPGTHNIRSTLADLPKYAQIPSVSTSPRDELSKNRNHPGPGEYHSMDPRNTAPAWGFGTSYRPGCKPDNLSTVRMEELPGPGTYQITSTVGAGQRVTIKGRHPGPKTHSLPGPGTHGGHYSSFG